MAKIKHKKADKKWNSEMDFLFIFVKYLANGPNIFY